MFKTARVGQRETHPFATDKRAPKGFKRPEPQINFGETEQDSIINLVSGKGSPKAISAAMFPGSKKNSISTAYQQTDPKKPQIQPLYKLSFQEQQSISTEVGSSNLDLMKME